MSAQKCRKRRREQLNGLSEVCPCVVFHSFHLNCVIYFKQNGHCDLFFYCLSKRLYYIPRQVLLIIAQQIYPLSSLQPIWSSLIQYSLSIHFRNLVRNSRKRYKITLPMADWNWLKINAFVACPSWVQKRNCAACYIEDLCWNKSPANWNFGHVITRWFSKVSSWDLYKILHGISS